jgi:hypothetical protein
MVCFMKNCLALFIFFISFYSYSQALEELVPDSYRILDIDIKDSEVKKLYVMKFNDEVSSLDYDAYDNLLFPQESSPELNLLSPDIRRAITDKHRRENRRVLCFYLKDIKKTLLCLFDSQESMEATVGNTMLFAWSDFYPEGPFYDSAPENYRFAGADMRGEDLVARSSMLRTGSNSDIIEKSFYSLIIEPEIKKHGSNFSLVSACRKPLSSNNYYRLFDKIVIAHELLHAQYFLDKNFRKSVDDYFNPIFENKKHKHHKLVTCIQRSLYETGVYPKIYQNTLKRNTELANVFLQLVVNSSKRVKTCGVNTNNPIAIELYEKILSSGSRMTDLYNSLYKKTPRRAMGNTNEYILFYNIENYNPQFIPKGASINEEFRSVLPFT